MIICDTHCDTLYMRALEKDKTPCVTMDNMVRGGMSLQTCTLFAGTKGVSDHPYDKAMAEYAMFEHLQETEGWQRVDSPLEAEEGKVKILLSIEGGEIFEGKAERVREFHDRGIRMAAIIWNNENEMAHSAKSGSKEGIKPLGWELLRVMAELKMAADTRLVSSVACHSARLEASPRSLYWQALFTRMSTRPKRASAAFRQWRIWSSWPRSVSWNSARSPISPASAWPAWALRPTSTTLARAAASPHAMSAPSPWVLPVTMAVLPAKPGKPEKSMNSP